MSAVVTTVAPDTTSPRGGIGLIEKARAMAGFPYYPLARRSTRRTSAANSSIGVVASTGANFTAHRAVSWRRPSSNLLITDWFVPVRFASSYWERSSASRASLREVISTPVLKIT